MLTSWSDSSIDCLLDTVQTISLSLVFDKLKEAPSQQEYMATTLMIKEQTVHGLGLGADQRGLGENGRYAQGIPVSFPDHYVHHCGRDLLSAHVSHCNVLAPSLMHDYLLALCQLQMEHAARSELTTTNMLRPW